MSSSQISNRHHCTNHPAKLFTILQKPQHQRLDGYLLSLNFSTFCPRSSCHCNSFVTRRKSLRKCAVSPSPKKLLFQQWQKHAVLSEAGSRIVSSVHSAACKTSDEREVAKPDLRAHNRVDKHSSTRSPCEQTVCSRAVKSAARHLERRRTYEQTSEPAFNGTFSLQALFMTHRRNCQHKTGAATSSEVHSKLAG